MNTTTYTLLVSIAHDGAAPSLDLLEAMVQRGLEEGVRDMAGVAAATTSAFRGDQLGTVRIGRQYDTMNRNITEQRALHAQLRNEK